MCSSSWLKNLNFQTPIKLIRGNFDSLTRPIIFILFLNLGFCLLCSGGGGSDEIMPLVSVPLGFEINGFDRSKIWVSENGIFSFGFLQSCEKIENENGDFDALIVGIRFNLGSKKGSNVPVWSIGGGIRVSENSTFRLSDDGRLVLIENSNSLIVWSSNTSNLRVEKATLLNNGNLVLMDDRNAVIWESFISPTSTLLPGQSLHFPQTLRAPSMETISSYYNFVLRRDGELALMWENNVTYWRSHFGTSPAITVKEARFDSNGVLTLVDVANNTVWSRSSQDFFEGSSRVFRRLKIDPDGNLRIYSWDDSARTWRVGWQAVEDQCNVFGFCGLYSLCGYNSTGPVCDCMSQHSRSLGNDQVDSRSSKCKPVSDLSSCKTNTSMMVLRQTTLYGLYPPIDVDLMLSEKSCKELCVNDTTCVAVTSKNDGSGLCTVKRTNFISGYRNPSLSSTSFMKVCLVPLAVSAESANIHPNVELIPPPLSKRSVTHGLGSKKLIGAIALLAFATIVIVVTVEVVALYAFFRRKQIKERDNVPFLKESKMNPQYSLLIRMALKEVRKATDNFSDVLSPSVFKGMLPNKTPIVAKVLNNVVSCEKDFRFSIATLGATHHRNLVAMKGFCFEASHKIILYEYIPNGSLHKWLVESCNDPSDRKWRQRLDIAIGVGRALAYLHTECQSCIPHGNLKLKNVLLDDKGIPMVTSFGICSLLDSAACSSSGGSSSCMESVAQRDIYMFGEMLLQIATLKIDVQQNEECDFDDNIVLNQQHHFDKSEREGGVERVVRIALWCMQAKPFLRPSVGEVVKVLEGTLSVDMPPSSSAHHHQIYRNII